MCLCKINEPLGRAIFLSQCYNLYNLGKGLLDDARYQISKALAFEYQTRRFLNVFSIQVYVKQMSPRAGPFFTGLYFEEYW